VLPRACVLLLGQEGTGLSEPARQACTAVLSVAQFGSTRSINAGAAAAVAMHAWVHRHVFGQDCAQHSAGDCAQDSAPDVTGARGG
jgi:tRNA(Leu) C34 or U34 (ribose-2'-O)-methylase TrmL